MENILLIVAILAAKQCLAHNENLLCVYLFIFLNEHIGFHNTLGKNGN